MKNALFTGLILLFVGMFVAVLPTEREGDIYTDTIRLHILARSDSEYDQGVKLKIRDKLLEKYGNELSSYDSVYDAENAIDSLLPSITKDVDFWLSELGCDARCKVYLTEEWYDTREYENFVLPRGTYTSLKIVIDEGAGKNWWCVMFPPLCLDIAVENTPADDATIGYTEEEIALTDKAKKYNVKFKMLEIISDIFA